MRLSSLRIEDERDILRLRQVGETVVAGAGLTGFAATRVVTALLELGRNLIDHASGGRLALLLSEVGQQVYLVADAVDQGPGMEAEGGPGGLGLGLRGVKRMADLFDLQSGAEGTRVRASFLVPVQPREHEERVRSLLAEVEQLQQGDPAELLARQNRELMEALQQRDLLMAEVHHRTKNNLSLVLGLMRLGRAASSSDETKDVLRDLEGRVSAIAKVHDQLQNAAASDQVELTALLRDVARQSASAFGSRNLAVTVDVEGAPIHVSSSPAVDLALVVGELITNACKYAFPGRSCGHVAITVEPLQDELKLRIADDGVGLAEGQERPERSGSLGWQMVRSMVQKHSGSLRTHGEGGLTVELTLDRHLLGARD
ncbi:sensor histidine kinase [Pseudoroseicyclus aestuarii]|uniref:histidine kinase n=1 Tax=Pseudoroseicyclus aestuarii TaxID=1795041 RepID=A0A318SUL8_9RHOB|nr:ATP-binding protein [Pseudoroseicyclus aestuarii]PYE85600.1 two-component sensor histidine kinase [Pseudoroseicyclus aestuarii]